MIYDKDTGIWAFFFANVDRRSNVRMDQNEISFEKLVSQVVCLETGYLYTGFSS
jgi:hypothetical protein